MCANPDSSPKSVTKKYTGIGGHLFTIAIDRSLQMGKKGEFYGFAANQKLYDYYERDLLATKLGLLHDYHFIMEYPQTKKIMEEYTYEWTDEGV